MGDPCSVYLRSLVYSCTVCPLTHQYQRRGKWYFSASTTILLYVASTTNKERSYIYYILVSIFLLPSDHQRFIFSPFVLFFSAFCAFGTHAPSLSLCNFWGVMFLWPQLIILGRLLCIPVPPYGDAGLCPAWTNTDFAHGV